MCLVFCCATADEEQGQRWLAEHASIVSHCSDIIGSECAAVLSLGLKSCVDLIYTSLCIIGSVLMVYYLLLLGY